MNPAKSNAHLGVTFYGGKQHEELDLAGQWEG